MARGHLDSIFWSQHFPKWAGAAAMLGGTLCVLAAFLHSMEPEGCVGWDCAGGFRSATGVVSVAGSAASVLILAGIAGLTMLGWRSGRHTRLATTGLGFAAASLIALLAGGLVQDLFFNGDFPGMPYVVIPGLLGVVVGLLLIGIFILRSHVMPRRLGIFFMVSSVALVAANEQTAAILLAIPFGLAMVAAGYFMWTGGTGYAAAPARP